jgi:hypothetical protein
MMGLDQDRIDVALGMFRAERVARVREVRSAIASGAYDDGDAVRVASAADALAAELAECDRFGVADDGMDFVA